MRLGIFGGTFDPVHLGHLILAEQCREQGRLDQVLFVLAARPPHKEEGAVTPFEKRVEMLTLAISGQVPSKVLGRGAFQDVDLTVEGYVKTLKRGVNVDG